MKKNFCYLFLALLFLSGQANAAEKTLDPIYFDSSANTIYGQTKKNYTYALDNFAEDVKTSGANIDIVSRKDIQKQNTPSFTDILSQIGSVTVQNANGSDGSPSSIRIRGTDRVKMTIDGIRADRTIMNTAGAESQFLLMDDIEQIEIIKGPQGNVSGTNASGGLIALQTRRGRGPLKFELGSDFGNYSTFKERFAMMGGSDKADYYLSTTWYKTDGGMRTSNLGEIRNDDYNNLSVVSNLGLRLLDNKAEIRDIFRFSRSRKGLGVGSNSTTWEAYQDPNNYSLNYDIMNNLIFKHAPTEKYDYDVKFGLYHNTYHYYGLPDSIDSIYTSLADMAGTRLNFMTQHNYKIASWNTLSAGYNLETEFINGSSSETYNYGNVSCPYDSKYSGNTIQNDVYLNDVINIKDKLFIRGGARLVGNSAYGIYVNPNASAALILPTFKIKGATTKFRGSWGQSVNTPTLYQRYGIVNTAWGRTVPSPNLKAEKYQSWDVGIEQAFCDDKLKFEFGYFNSNYRDYISYNWGYLYSKYINIDSAKIQGYEAKASWEPNDKFKIVLNYTYTDAKDNATGYDLPATPRNRFNGTIYYTPFERWTMYFGLISASERTYSSSNPSTAPGYIDAQIGTSVRLFTYKGASMFLRANIYNLFNQDICMYKAGDVYYYSPRIRFRAGLFMEYNLPQKMKPEERV